MWKLCDKFCKADDQIMITTTACGQIVLYHICNIATPAPRKRKSDIKKLKLKKNNKQTNKQIHNTTLFLRLSYIFSSSVWHDPLKRISNK